MKTQSWLMAAVMSLIVIFGTYKILQQKSELKLNAVIEKSVTSSYWTCPMHPQIHSDKPGECPICHMKLVQVKTQSPPATENQDTENRSAVVVSPAQMPLLGIQKQTVEKMDLTFHIPVSGRLLSPSTVAFQVFEGDLRYIKTGLRFSGESSFSPDAEITGTISSVDKIVDPTSRTVRVVGTIQSGPRGLIAETTFRGEVSFELKNVIAISESSVLHTGSGALVYLFTSNGSLQATPVKLGLKTESFYEVLKGLEPGQSISSGPNFLIDSEAKIRGTSGQPNH